MLFRHHFKLILFLGSWFEACPYLDLSAAVQGYEEQEKGKFPPSWRSLGFDVLLVGCQTLCCGINSPLLCVLWLKLIEWGPAAGTHVSISALQL